LAEYGASAANYGKSSEGKNDKKTNYCLLGNPGRVLFAAAQAKRSQQVSIEQ
jgi:hypothetical protein